MEDSNLFRYWPRVAAPPGFEERVVAEMAKRRLALPAERRARTFRMALGGAAAAILAAFVGLNVLTGPRGAGSTGNLKAIHLTEPLDYGSEFRGSASESRPVYILENVSYASNAFIKY